MFGEDEREFGVNKPTELGNWLSFYLSQTFGNIQTLKMLSYFWIFQKFGLFILLCFYVSNMFFNYW